MRRGRDDWVRLAETRLQNVLRQRIAANIRQLEVKISESGPPDMRPQPHILKTALDNLSRAGRIHQIKPGGESRHEEAIFYTLHRYYPEPANTRVRELLLPYRVHRMLTDKDEYCSKVLEDIVRASFAAAAQYQYLGNLPKATPLDAVYRFDSYILGVEVKNVRPWLYPMSGRIWVMIRKCLELDALPLLVTRKIAYLTRSAFSRLGILGFEFHRQVFSPLTHNLLSDIRHTDRLGYKDVVALPPDPYPPLVAFLQNTLPRQIASYRDQWVQRAGLLAEFAKTRNLGDPNMRDPQREAHYPAFASAVFYEEYEEEEPDIDVRDYYY